MNQLRNDYTIGLRIDVDTFSGTRDGVPRLLQLFAEHQIQASFFFSVGPDNMGRHLWRLLKPAFLYKMWRSQAASLYGWDILLRGTLWPGPMIGKHLASVIRDTQQSGHEIGLHAWDHHYWQTHLDTMTRAQIQRQLQLGMAQLESILGEPVQCSAAAGWKCTNDALQEKHALRLNYNSDCRGDSIFRPVVDGQPTAPQIPVTLPTYDEIIGRDGINDHNYNDHILSLLRPDALNVLTIHAEVEGVSRTALLEKFLVIAKALNIKLLPLYQLLPEQMTTIPTGNIVQHAIAGREGRVCWQNTDAIKSTT